MVEYRLKESQVKQLEEALARISKEKGEEVINRYLKDKGAPDTMLKIKEYMPLSDSKYVTTFAKLSDSLKAQMLDLGFKVKTKEKYHYLVFPDQGRGKRNKKRQDFFMRGLEEQTKTIVEELKEEITKAYQEEIGG